MAYQNIIKKFSISSKHGFLVSLCSFRNESLCSVYFLPFLSLKKVFYISLLSIDIQLWLRQIYANEFILFFSIYGKNINIELSLKYKCLSASLYFCALQQKITIIDMHKCIIIHPQVALLNDT